MVYRPTDRERQRYITFTGPNPLQTFRTLFGVHGEAEAGIQLHGNVIRTTSAHVQRVRAAICLTPGCRTHTVTSSITKARAEEA
jgi:hypothetical protein